VHALSPATLSEGTLIAVTLMNAESHHRDREARVRIVHQLLQDPRPHEKPELPQPTQRHSATS
jgi:hypothetical protein